MSGFGDQFRATQAFGVSSATRTGDCSGAERAYSGPCSSEGQSKKNLRPLFSLLRLLLVGHQIAHQGDTLREGLALLKFRTGHDFSSDKRPTLLRRIARRLQVHQVDDLPAYVDLLREHPEELQALMRDLLIRSPIFSEIKKRLIF